MPPFSFIVFVSFQANSLADSSFPCPLCGSPMGDDIIPVECTVALEVTWLLNIQKPVVSKSQDLDFLEEQKSSSARCIFWACKYGKISAQPHTALCIQFVDRENNDKKKYIAIGKTDLFYNSMGMCGNFSVNTLCSGKVCKKHGKKTSVYHMEN